MSTESSAETCYAHLFCEQQLLQACISKGLQADFPDMVGCSDCCQLLHAFELCMQAEQDRHEQALSRTAAELVQQLSWAEHDMSRPGQIKG